MKRLLIIISTVSFMFADSAVGNWKLSGLTVDYFDIAREDVTVVLNDAYGFGITVPISTIPAGLMFNHTARGPWGDAALQAAGVNLNVNLYPDGTGVIGEGSYYPDVDLIPGTCITQGQVFPITDAFNWNTSDVEGNPITTAFPAVNILGIPSANALAGQTAYGLGVNGSTVFDNWEAEESYIPTPSVLPGIFLADGTVLSYPAAYGGVTAGTWGGYYRQGEDMHNSNMGQDLMIDFVLEWSAIDGWESESGLGDDLDVDEDGDGTEYDRIFGIPYASSTYINQANPLCDITGGALTGVGEGLAYPVIGDIVSELGGEDAVAALVTGSCLQGVVDGAYDNCIGQVYDGVMAQCAEAGGPVAAVTGLCYEASQTEDFAGACAYYGAAGALTATCLQLGFSTEVCSEAATQAMPAVDGYCIYTTGMSCADAGISECAVLTNPEFSFGLCGTLAGALTESETCEEWTDSFYDYDEDESSETYGDIIGDSFFDANAASVLGVSCTDFSAGLAAGFAAGDPTTIATIDGLFESAAGMSCTNYGASYTSMCVESVAGANDVYLMDTSLETWGLFLTYNAASVQQYQAAGYDMATIMYYFPYLFENDSAWDFDPTCYYGPDQIPDTGDEFACSGRLVMNFPPTCVPEVEAHQIVAEFVDLGSLNCEGTGDVAGGFDNLPCVPTAVDENGDLCVCDLDSYGECAATTGDVLGCSDEFLCYDNVVYEEYEGPAGDGIVNVVDVVKLVGHILNTSPLGGYLLCEADISGDGVVNVVDVVGMVNIILNGGGLGSNDATEATIVDNGTSVSITSNGYIGAIDMTIEFNGQFDISLDDKFVGDMVIEGNTAHVVLVGLNKNELVREDIEGTILSYEGEIVAISQEIANSRELVENITFSDGNLPSGYAISNAYPNPFNPSTSFEMRLDVASDVTVKIYNLTGQLVDVIAEGNFTADTHTFTWNAENLASGVYFISTQVGSNIENQKVMLIK